jgi:dolichol-phosphate mannosyltransferase
MISLVVPCYNESEGLEATLDALAAAAPTWREPYEIVLVDDGSRDNTWQLISEAAARDARIRGVRLSRNFGHQAAIGAGLHAARGDAVAVLDADLQDPPSLIAEMLDLWRAGHDVVYAQRNRRQGESLLKRVSGNLFYRLLARVNNVSIPRDTGDFALVDRGVVDQLVALREHQVFWRGLRCWAGFKHAAVRFDRPLRTRGESKYTLRKLIRLASAGLLSFSELPARLALYAGLGTGVLLFVAVVASAWRGAWLAPPTALALGFLGAVQLFCLGIVGEYVNRIYDEVRDRPRWIVAQQTFIGNESALPLRRQREAG